MANVESKNNKYCFTDFTLDVERGALLKAGREVKLRPKVYDALRFLVENRGRLVPKEELIQSLWPDAFVTDDSLVQCMVELRRALDDQSQEILKTVPRRGYTFAAAVTIESRDTQAAPKDQQVSPQRITGAYHLPVPRTPLIGRERELASVRQLLLDPDIRLVTLTGAGGSGKTRLGLRVAEDLVEAFAGHVYFVALGSISDAAMVPHAIAEALGIRETGGRRLVELLKQYLRESLPSPTLLFLDNLEHILPAATFVVELIEAARPLKVLVTSRSPLRVYGEHEFSVPPLELPQTNQLRSLDTLVANPAVALFAQRAAAVKPDFKVTQENAPIVAEICSRLDGLPLAIELAAARVKMLPLPQILARLESRLQLLTTGARDLPQRQQTLRNAIDWSYGLLSEAEQKLFRRLGVFWGGCTLEGAEAVCDTRNDLGGEIFELMSSLVDKSLIQQRQHGDEEPRFRMLETIREYSLEHLHKSGEDAASQRSHAAYCLVLAEEGNPELNESDRATWLSLCELQHDDFRAALDWLFHTRDLDWGFRMCLALFKFWDMREYITEGRARLEAIVRLAGAAHKKERAKACLFLGALTTAQGDFQAAERFVEKSLVIYEELNDDWGIGISLNAFAIGAREQGDYVAAQSNFEKSLGYWRKVGDRVATARCLHNLANVAKNRGDYARARLALDEALHIFAELGDRSGAAWSLNQQGDVAREQGDLDGARAIYQQALSAFRDIGDHWGSARSLADLGAVACDQGNYAAAHAAYRESLEVFTSLEHKRGIARVLEGLACVALAKGDARRALAVVAAGAHLRQRMSAPLPPTDQAKLDQRLVRAWETLGELEGNAAWTTGWEMTLEDAVEYSLDDQSSATSLERGQSTA